jgi:Rrf2 family protein
MRRLHHRGSHGGGGAGSIVGAGAWADLERDAMKFTRGSRYALQALMHLAREGGGGRLFSHAAARACGIPRKPLLGVLRPLVTAGVLRSLNGRHGGYRLARPAQDITLLEVIEAVDGPIRGDAPPVGAGKEGAALAKRLQEACDRAAELVRGRLAKVTLADLVRRKRRCSLNPPSRRPASSR